MDWKRQASICEAWKWETDRLNEWVWLVLLIAKDGLMDLTGST